MITAIQMMYVLGVIVSFFPFLQVGSMVAYHARQAGWVGVVGVLCGVLIATLMWPVTWSAVIWLFLSVRKRA